MARQQLIRRDLPLEIGRRLRFEFTVRYELTLDHDWLPDGPASLDEFEKDLAGPHIDEEALWRDLQGAGDRQIIEHTVYLRDLEADWTVDSPEPRFEEPWEAGQREQGKTETFAASREWLDEIPAAAETEVSA